MNQNTHQASRLFIRDMNAHGAAEFATRKHLQERGFGSDKPHFMAYGMAAHIKEGAFDIGSDLKMSRFYLGGTRSGKLTCAIAQFCLTYPGPLVVMDNKSGEIAKIVALYRKNIMGRNVILFDKNDCAASALGIKAQRITFIDDIDPKNDSFVEDCFDFAEAIVMSDQGSNKDQHWDIEAIALIAGLTAYVKTAPLSQLPDPAAGRTMEQIRCILTLTPQRFKEVIAGKYIEEENKDGTEIKLVMPGMVHAQHRFVAKSAGRILSKEHKEMSSVKSTALANTHFLDTESTYHATAASDFSFSDLEDGETDIFIITDAERIETEARLNRLVLSQVTKRVARFKKKPAINIAIILEEMAAMGRHRVAEKLFSVFAGLGVVVLAVMQDLNQLFSIYGDMGRSMLANSGSVHFLGVNDPTTAEYIEKHCGKTTLHLLSEDSVKRRAGLLQDPKYFSKDDTLIQRLLVPVEESLTMHRGIQLILVNGANPAVSWKVPYFLDARFRDRKGKPIYTPHPDYADLPLPKSYDFTYPGLDIESLIAPYMVGG